MLKYDEFITESQIISLILESDLNCSSEFLNRLEAIKGKSVVANALHVLFANDTFIYKPLSQNFIDISDSEDTLSFISDKKADKAFDDDKNPYQVSGRGEIKVGRFAKSILSDKEILTGVNSSRVLKMNKIDLTTLKDKDYEEFVNLYKASKVKKDHKFQLVTGKDILTYYDVENYAFSEKGTLGNSCMKHEECRSYLEIYQKNPKSCSLLVYLNATGEVLGRALIWNLSKSPCKAKYFMDRIYTTFDSDVIKFTNYADENGFMYKIRQGCDDTESLIFKYKGSSVLGEARVELDKVKFDDYPFLDTLSYLNTKEKHLSNVNFKGAYSLNDTEGGSSQCYFCDGSGTSESNCEDCNGGGDIDCPKCEGGKYTPKYGCKKCEDDGVVKCKSCDGTGVGDCNECVNEYLEILMNLLNDFSRYGLTKDQVELEIQKIKSEKLKSKKKK